MICDSCFDVCHYFTIDRIRHWLGRHRFKELFEGQTRRIVRRAAMFKSGIEVVGTLIAAKADFCQQAVCHQSHGKSMAFVAVIFH